MWNSNTPLPPSTKIKVRAPGSGLIASQVMVPFEGDVTTTLVPGVFSNIVSTGLQYRIKVGAGLIDPFDFRVTIDCAPAPGTGCVYKLEGGLKSKGAVPLTPALGAVLDALGGSPDLLATVLAADPSLQGEIATLALELDRLDWQVGIPADVCSCVWTYAAERTPAARTFDPFETRDFEEGGFEGPGAAHNYGAQSIGRGGTGLAAVSKSRIEMALRCWDFESWGVMTVDLPGGPQDIELPALTSCPAPCTGEIKHAFRLEARLAALAVGGPMSDGISMASQSADYSVDNTPLINETWSASVVGDANPGPSQGLRRRLGNGLVGAYETDIECVDRSMGQVRTAPTSAELQTTGSVSVDGGDDAFGIAETGNRYLMEAVGFASCAVKPAWQVTLTDVLSFAGEPPLERPQRLVIQPYCWD